MLGAGTGPARKAWPGDHASSARGFSTTSSPAVTAGSRCSWSTATTRPISTGSPRIARGYAVTLHAYCLMPNHVHLVLRTAEASLARFMQSLQQSYTQRFNRRYGQVGHVFQGRYKALLCETDEYLVTLVRYVHLNPVRAGLAARAEDYPYSGHRAYLGGSGDGSRRSHPRAEPRRRRERLHPAGRRRHGGQPRPSGSRDSRGATRRNAGASPVGRPPPRESRSSAR